MKKAIASLLCLCLLIPLASCGKNDVEAGKTQAQGNDLSNLSPAQLYAQSSENGKNLISSVYETQIQSQGEEETVTTTRIRHGYEGFSFSRVSGDRQICYLDGIAYLSSQDRGHYSVSCAARVFQEYLDKNVFPIGNLDSGVLTRVERDGMTLRYEGDVQFLAEPFSLLVSREDGEFLPEKIQGEATFSQDLLIQKEVITVTGLLTRGDESQEIGFVLTTTLSQFRSETITVTPPAEQFVELEDIRILTMAPQAILALKNAGELEATVLSSQTLTAGEQSYSIHEENTLYKKGEGSGLEYYFSRQTLFLSPGGEESQFEQTRMKGGTYQFQRYNLLTGRLLEEETKQEGETSLPGKIETFVTDFGELTFTGFSEEAESYTLKAKLTEGVRNEWILPLLQRSFGASSVGEMTVAESSVSLTIQKNSGCLTAISYAFSGAVLQGSVKGNLTLTVDAMENVTVPDLQDVSAINTQG